jgi:hypothetical protein
MSSRILIALDKSAMSMMEYSGDFGGVGGACQRLVSRRVDSSNERRVERGLMWVDISVGEGSRVRRTTAVDRSEDCVFELVCVLLG